MRRLAAVIRDEYLAVLRNPGTLLVFLGGLLVYSMMYPLPYTNQVIREVPVVPVDLDRSAMSRRLLRWPTPRRRCAWPPPRRTSPRPATA